MPNSFRLISHLVLYLSLFFASSSHAEVLNPYSLKDMRGESTSQPLSVLNKKDQKKSDDNWDNYIEFTTGSKGYRGIFKFKQEKK